MKSDNMQAISELDNIKAIEKIIGYTFNDKSILQRAITHSSYNVMMNRDDESYERMEFLGDSILDFVISDELFRNYPQLDEGMLTKFRANIVSSVPLAEIVNKSKIIEYILYDKKSPLSGKKISDYFESIVAAIYLDSNSLRETRKFILKYLKPYINEETKKDPHEYKPMLYEYCAREKKSIKFEQKSIAGPPHDLTFTMQLLVDGKVISEATGKKKQDAEKECSKIALIKFGVIKN